MIDLVANKFFKGNKNLAFMVVAGTGLVFIILVIILIANLSSGGIKNYSELENELISSTKKYYNNNSDKLPVNDGGKVTITDAILIEAGYIKELKKLYSKDTCSATINVIKSGEEYLYNPILKCENYTTKTLVEQLKNNVVSSESGLYFQNNEYVFKGEYINNYVEFDGKLWRIVKIDDNGIKMYLEDKKIETNVWDDRYNIEKKSDYGKNVYDTSRISVYLEDAYKNNKFVSEKNKKYLVNAKWCIGSISENTLISNINLCDKTMNSYVGLLNADDYAKASLEPACKYFDDVQCVNYNYMNSLNKTNWTLNAYEGNTHDVYAITSSGASKYRASRESAVRPTIYLNSDVLLKSGEGSEKTPYMVK